MKPRGKGTHERLLPRFALRYRAYRKLIRDRESYVHATGWMRSLAERSPVDGAGNPIPWMNFPVVRFLEQRLRRDLSLFEFGSGHSTLFFAARVRSVTSVEHDVEFHRFLGERLPQNVELIFAEEDVDGDYCRVIESTHEAFDVVVVDGRDRVNCLKRSLPALSTRGVLLLDDSHRERYREGLDHAAAAGFRSLDFEGMKPGRAGISQARILYRSENCLGL